MARGPEGAFWKKVRGAWPGHAVRVEASLGEVEVGTADTVLGIGGRNGWVELKVWPDPLSDQQIAWHAEALDRGSYAMVLCEMPGGRVWLGNYHDYVRAIETCAVEGASVVRSLRLQLLHDALDVIACALSRR